MADETRIAEPVVAERKDEPSETMAAPKICPHCGWDITRSVDEEPTEADYDDFGRTVISGERFKKTYAFLNDRVRVTVQTRVVDETERVLEHVGKMLNTSASSDENLQRVIVNSATKYNILFQLCHLELEMTPKNFKTPDDTDDLEKIHGDLVKGMSETVYSFIWSAVFRLNRLTAKMEVEASKPNFSKAVSD